MLVHVPYVWAQLVVDYIFATALLPVIKHYNGSNIDSQPLEQIEEAILKCIVAEAIQTRYDAARWSDCVHCSTSGTRTPAENAHSGPSEAHLANLQLQPALVVAQPLRAAL